MPEYDLGRAVVRIEVDYSALGPELAAARALTAAEIGKMQRDINAATKGMSADFDGFARNVRSSMAQVGASTEAGSALGARNLQKLSSAAMKAEAAMNSLADTTIAAGHEVDSATNDMAGGWVRAAIAAKASADAQIDAIRRVVAAQMAADALMRSTPGMAAPGAPGAPGGPGGPGGTAPASSPGLTTATLTSFLLGRSSLSHRANIPFTRFGLPVIGAAIGSPASFAGLGVEHVVMTMIGLFGNLAAAGAGAATLIGGAFSKMAVGIGSDMAVVATAENNVKSVTSAIDNYQTAVATYGKNSTQAATAQAKMNFAIKDVPAAVRGETVALAKANIAIEGYWKTATVGAVHQADMIFAQLQQLARKYIPLISSAAQTNLTIINQAIKPLFTWLEGPQGIGQFQKLEDEFANQLPTSIHAGTQAIELILRYFAQASQYTGGLVRWIDTLATRLNNLSNVQIDLFIQHLIRDFDLWKNLIKAVATDIILLFRNEQGTAGSILQTLTDMLVKVGDWERTIHARQMISTIFEVHRQEVVALLHAIGLLLPTFTSIYMTLAPPMTRIFTLLVRGLNDVLKLLHEIPGGDWLVGLTLLTVKFKSWGFVLGMVSRGLMAVLRLLGLYVPAEGAAAVAEGAVAAGAGVEAAALGAEETATVAATGALAPFVAAMSAFTAALAPAAALAAAPVIGSILLAHGQHPTDVTSFQRRALGIAPPAPGTPRQLVAPGREEALTPPSMLAPAIKQSTMSLTAWMDAVKNATGAQQTNVHWLNMMLENGRLLARQYPAMSHAIDKNVMSLKAQRAATEEVTNLMTSRWKSALSDTTTTLGDLTDLFSTNMRRIQDVIGLNTSAGRALMRKNLDGMVHDVTQMMDKNKVSVTKGMEALKNALEQGVKTGAITVEQEYGQLFTTLANLRAHDKISQATYLKDLQQLTQQYTQKQIAQTEGDYRSYFQYLAELSHKGLLTQKEVAAEDKAVWINTTDTIIGAVSKGYSGLFADLRAMAAHHLTNTKAFQGSLHMIWVQGAKQITSSIDQARTQQEAIWKEQARTGQITWAQYWSNVHALNNQAGQQQHNDMQAWAAQIYSALAASGKTTFSGAQAIWKELESLVGPLGAQMIPHPISVATLKPAINPWTGVGTGVRPQTGAILQIGQEGQKGSDTIPGMIGNTPIMVAPGEQVAFLTSHHQQELNAMLAPVGGLEGYFSRRKRPHSFATGGYVYPIGPGAISSRIDEGKDYTGGPFNVAALGPGTVLRNTLWPGWPGTGGVVYRLSAGPRAGMNVYQMEHQVARVGVGQQVRPGQIVTTSLPGYPWLEIGWANAAGTGPLTPYNGAPDGTPMPGGIDFANFIAALSHGQIAPASLLGMMAPHIMSPHILGPNVPLTNWVQKGMDFTTAAGNKWLARKFAAMQPSFGSISGIPPGAGPVEQQMLMEGMKLGLTRVAVAGMIGNAAQESGLDPNLNQPPNAIGLFSWISSNPEASSIVLGNVPEQVALAMSGLSPAAFNAASTSAAAAATWFMNTFERPNAALANLPNRIAAAQQALAQGYQSGGRLMPEGFAPYVGDFFNGGMIPGPAGAPRIALVHGHETVTPVGQAPVQVIISRKGGELERLIDVQIKRYGQRVSRAVSRSSISAGGY